MALIRGHYIPKFLLRGFTIGGGENDPLFVFDQERQRSWRSTPVNSAKETGMYAGQGPDPELMEKTMAKAEGVFGQITADVIRTATLPTGDDLSEFMGFIAVMLVRVPRHRDRYERLRAVLSSPEVRKAVSIPDGAKALEDALRKCNVAPIAFAVEELKAVLEAEVGDLLLHPNLYLYGMSQNAADLVPLLRQRTWRLWTCEESAPDLICSDHPVSIEPVCSTLSQHFGLRSAETSVTMPLNRRMIVVGTRDPSVASIKLDQQSVAGMNSLTSMYASQVYSATEDFVWMMNDWRIGTARDFLSSSS